MQGRHRSGRRTAVRISPTRPVSQLVQSVGSRLPHGWRDLFRQIVLFVVAYQGYQVVRGIADAHPAAAMANGMDIIELERSIGTFFEPAFQQAFLEHQWIIDAANWMYFNSHFVITTAFLVWLYLYRNDHFNFVRNMFLVAMGIALVGYVLYPTAPPRMFPAAGFTDTIAAFTNTNQDASFTSLLVNPYAAIPSMHIAFALMIAVSAVNLVRSAWARLVWSVYPLTVLFVIVVTANHFWFDAAVGAMVACMAAVSAHQLARLRPDAWSWREAADEVPA
jgi:hypothetical protein